MSMDTPHGAAAGADLCRYLSACYYEPTPAFAEEKLFDSMQLAAAAIDPELAAAAQRLGQAFASTDLQTLLVDHTRLFMGPVQPLARPYGSFWLSGETPLMQASTLAVVDLYRQGGFDMDEAFMELPDHVAVELEFLYQLAFRRLQAQHAGAADDQAAFDALQARFVGQHLGAWIGPFTAAMRTGAETDFYRELAGLTQRVVDLQASSLEGGPP